MEFGLNKSNFELIGSDFVSVCDEMKLCGKKSMMKKKKKKCD